MQRGSDSTACCGGVLERLANLDEHAHELAGRLLDILHNGVVGERLEALWSITALTGLEDSRELTRHLAHARALEIPPAEVMEAIIINANYSGLRVVEHALEVFSEVFDEPFQGQSTDDYPPGPDVDGFHGPALLVGEQMYGPARARANVQMFRGWGETITAVVEDVIYGGIDRRTVLSHIERELCSVAVLAALRRSFALEWHARVALELGASRQLVEAAVVSQLAHVGFPPTVDALIAIDGVVAAWKSGAQTQLSWD